MCPVALRVDARLALGLNNTVQSVEVWGTRGKTRSCTWLTLCPRPGPRAHPGMYISRIPSLSPLGTEPETHRVNFVFSLLDDVP